MSEFEIVLSLLVIVLAVTVVARRLGWNVPVVLTLAGLVLAVVPAFPEIVLAPDLVFSVFLPPILFSAAASTSWRDFRQQFAAISFLAIGLVLVTTAGVALVALAIMPGLPVAAAIALGAIVSPSDAVATVAIVQRIGVPRRIITILEGESLINDATALVSYQFAVAAVLTGAFVFWQAGLSFVVSVAGGLLLGYLIGRAAIMAVPRLGDDGGVIATFITAFTAYLAAEAIGVSGVLATVMAGLVFGRYLALVGSPAMRLANRTMWNHVIFIINGLVFILIGLEMQPILEDLAGTELIPVLGWAAAVGAAAIVIRILWVFGATFLLRLVDRVRPGLVPHVPSVATSAVVGWAGLRGVVTLATALALPRLTESGAPFPYREVIVFLAAAVIVVTLIGQGLTLAPLVRMLGFDDDQTMDAELLHARREATLAALHALETLSHEDWVPTGPAKQLRSRYERRLARLPEPPPGGFVVPPSPAPRAASRLDAQTRLALSVIDAERQALIALRNAGEINDEVLQHLSSELDQAALRPIN